MALQAPKGTTDLLPKQARIWDHFKRCASAVFSRYGYEPIETPLLASARAAGAMPVTGIGMLVHQAAHAFRSWTGEDPPVEVMSAAAVAALAARHA